MRQIQSLQGHCASSTHMRRRHILSQLKVHRQTKHINSTVTINSDVTWLKAHLLLDMANDDMSGEHFNESKRSLGEVAADFVDDGDCIALDGSPLCKSMVPFLEETRDVTVVTNSMALSLELMQSESLAILLPGGIIRPQATTLTGPWSEAMLKQINIKTAFVSARGMSFDKGLTEANYAEASWKRTVVEAAREVVVLLDARSWGEVAFMTFCPTKRIKYIVTDPEAPTSMVQEARDQGLEVWLAPIYGEQEYVH